MTSMSRLLDRSRQRRPQIKASKGLNLVGVELPKRVSEVQSMDGRDEPAFYRSDRENRVEMDYPSRGGKPALSCIMVLRVLNKKIIFDAQHCLFTI